MSAGQWAAVGIAALFAAAAFYLNHHGTFRHGHGRRQLGQPPQLDPESALLIAQADAERISLDRLRGRLPRPAAPLAPLPEGTSKIVGPGDEGGRPWPVSGTGRVIYAGRPALRQPAARPATQPVTAPSQTIMLRDGRELTEEEAAGLPVVLPAQPRAPRPDETGEKLISRAHAILPPPPPGRTPRWARDIIGHDDNAAAVESMFTRAMAAQVREAVSDR